jgi:predicted esterase
MICVCCSVGFDKKLIPGTTIMANDCRNAHVVPIANGYELRQGLLDVGVRCEMVVYTGYGHGITNPKSQRAVLSHNKDWFGEQTFALRL